MTSAEPLYETLALDVENVGGITETRVELSQGVTVLKGQNATNRTSFLRAIMAAMGSDQFNLKGDADHGRVRLELDDTIVEREFNRRNGIVDTANDGYLDDSETADLFAFLLEANEARQAISQGENLRELITRPIDTDEINGEIDRLHSEKRDVDEQIERIDERERDLVELEQRKKRLEAEIEEHNERLDDLEAEIEAADADLGTQQEVQTEVEAKFDELKVHRSELEEVRFQIETAEETIDSLQAERKEKRRLRDDLAGNSEVDVDTLRNKLDELREQKRRLNKQLSELQSIVQLNEDILEEADGEIADVLRDGAEDESSGAVTDKLLADGESVVCWTCGSHVSHDDVESTLKFLRSFRQEKLSDRRSIQDEIDEVNDRISEYQNHQRELDTVERRLTDIDDKIEEKRNRVNQLEARRDDIREEVESLEEAVEQEQSVDYSDLLDLHKQANSVEVEIEQKTDELSTVKDEIADIESLLADRDEYETRRERLTEQLNELRNRIDQLERNAIEEFNSRMEEVLDILEYENVARVWIERRERETSGSRQAKSHGYFELHIVRESETGSTYQGTVDTLSESEREIIGLVFALAGYLVYDLHKTVPVMVLDSLEAIDSNRIARLVEYFAEYPDFLVVALLPEDASAINFDHETVTQL